MLFVGHTGEGAFSFVFSGTLGGESVAIKEYKTIQLDEDLLADFEREVTTLQLLRHPNLLRFRGACLWRSHLCIVTEFLERGSLKVPSIVVISYAST